MQTIRHLVLHADYGTGRCHINPALGGASGLSEWCGGVCGNCSIRC